MLENPAKFGLSAFSATAVKYATDVCNICKYFMDQPLRQSDRCGYSHDSKIITKFDKFMLKTKTMISVVSDHYLYIFSRASGPAGPDRDLDDLRPRVTIVPANVH